MTDVKVRIVKQVGEAEQPCNKETVYDIHVIVNTKAGLEDIITVRTYTGRSSNATVVHACVWVHGDNYRSGKGKAGGYGYCKHSAAISDALCDAGIEVRPRVGGCGMGRVRTALEALARKLGYKGHMLVVGCY